MTLSTGSLLFVLGSSVVLLAALPADPINNFEGVPAGARGMIRELLDPDADGNVYRVSFEAPYQEAEVSEHCIELASGMQEPAANDTAEGEGEDEDEDEGEAVPAVIGPNGSDLLVQRAVVLRALTDERWGSRTAKGIANATGVPQSTVRFLFGVMPDYVTSRSGYRGELYTITDAGRAAVAAL